MRWTDIWILYSREMRGALRERSVVVNSLVLPLVLYPVLLWATFAAIQFVQGQQDRLESRVVLDGVGDELAERIRELEGVSFEEPEPGVDAEEAVRTGDVDAVLTADGELGPDVRFELVYDASEDRSRRARDRLEGAVSAWRDELVEGELETRGVGPPDREIYRIDRRNVATGEEVGAFLLGLMVPMLMIIMIAVGCYYPAVDSTAGEHERSTWETSMTLAASRTSLLLGKYFYVATMGLLAGLINLFAMTVSMRTILGPLLEDAGETMSFAIPASAVPLVVVAAALLSLFIAAGMMLFAAFARTFKEGQSMIGPFYMVVILPPLLVQSPDLELDLKMAAIPIVNVTLLFRGALQGVVPWLPTLVTLVVEAATIALLLALARRVLEYEDVVVGTYEGSLAGLIKDRLLPGRRSG